jgi:hypothetical protein
VQCRVEESGNYMMALIVSISSCYSNKRVSWFKTTSSFIVDAAAAASSNKFSLSGSRCVEGTSYITTSLHGHTCIILCHKLIDQSCRIIDNFIHSIKKYTHLLIPAADEVLRSCGGRSGLFKYSSWKTGCY